MSHEVVNDAVPVGMNWNEHSYGTATTVTGDYSSACSSTGFTALVRALNSGK